jgi:hypothetical protein
MNAVTLDTNLTLTVKFTQPVFGRVLKDASTTNLAATTDLPSASDDAYNGDALEWLSGQNKGEWTPVSDYVGASKLLSFGPMGLTPKGGDQFVIHHLITLTGQTAKIVFQVDGGPVEERPLTLATNTGTYTFAANELRGAQIVGEVRLVNSSGLESTSIEEFVIDLRRRRRSATEAET